MSIEQYISNDSNKKSSHWESPDIIKKDLALINLETGYCRGCGISIISDGHISHVDNSDTHTVIFGSTGSKKTRLLVMPLINNIILAGESFIATDPKEELYKRTSGLATEEGYKIIVINLRDFTQSDSWNPMSHIYELYHSEQIDESMEVLNDFINTIAADERKKTKDPYFINLACELILANSLVMIETATKEEFNVYNLMILCMATANPEKAEAILSCLADESITAIHYKGVLTNKIADRTYANVASETAVILNAFLMRKSLCQILSQSSFDIKNIGREKTAVYIIIPDEKDTLHFIVSIFIKQLYEILIGEAQKQEDMKLPVRVNFVLDEFGNIPEIPGMASMITAARSRNIRFFLMAQGMRQLEEKYDKSAETIKGNCDNIVFLTSREPQLLDEMSRLCGNASDGQPLISTSELQLLSKERGEALILHSRYYPFISELPDIDDYVFKRYPPVNRDNRPLPAIVRYNIDNVIDEIKTGKRPLPFSIEVYSEETFYKNVIIEKKNDIFDW